MALSAEGLSVVQHGAPLFCLVAMRWCAGSPFITRSYVACREKAEREASANAVTIDSQSVKSAEKGGSHRSAWL
jgi:hypothetical protein